MTAAGTDVVVRRGLLPVHVQLTDRAAWLLAEGDREEVLVAGRAGVALAWLSGDPTATANARAILGHTLLMLGEPVAAAGLATEQLLELPDPPDAAEAPDLAPVWRARFLALRAAAEVEMDDVMAALDDLAEGLALVETREARTPTEMAAVLSVAAVLVRLSLFELASELLARVARRELPGTAAHRMLAVRSLLSVDLVWGTRLELLGEEGEAAQRFARAATWALLLGRIARAAGSPRLERAAIATEAYALERLGAGDLGAARARAALAEEPEPEAVVEWLPGRLAMAGAAWSAGDGVTLKELLDVVERESVSGAVATRRDLWESLARPALARLSAPVPGSAAREHPAVAFLREIAVAGARRMWQERDARAADLRQRILRAELARRGERTARELQVDALTGLGNRRRLEQELATGRHRAVLFLDLDRFKAVNDTYGHVVGDAVLRRVADILRTCCREGDVLVRYGGDEFVVLVGGTGEHADPVDLVGADEVVHGLGSRLIDAVRAADWSDLVGSLPVRVSVGVARGEPGAALRRSDAAMLAAKRAGRDTLVRL